MNSDDSLTQTFRSPKLACADSSLLLVIDVQEKLLPLVQAAEQLQWNIGRLMRGACHLNVETLLTEQYPEKLGFTASAIRQLAGEISSKRMFSCRECASQLESARSAGKRQAILCGMETHVCVLQTALDLAAGNWDVYVVADAVTARGQLDHDIALDRMRSSGLTLATTESILFEWCETSLHPQFRAISQIVRETFPPLRSDTI